MKILKIILVSCLFSNYAMAEFIEYKHDIQEASSVTSLFTLNPDKNYSSIFELRTQRKVGIGTSIGGTSGAIGLNVELNFEDENGAIAGFGTGAGYNSATIAWKHLLNNEVENAYFNLGYSSWYESTGNNGQGGNSTNLGAILSKEEMNKSFKADFVFASIGLQQNILNGEYAGLTFYGELSMMAEYTRRKILPIGSIGATYYF